MSIHLYDFYLAKFSRRGVFSALFSYNNVKNSSSSICTCTVMIFAISSSYPNLKIMDYEYKSDDLDDLEILGKKLCKIIVWSAMCR